ncbi:hypothetical protein JCM17844_25450 [Iodidimonas gelatinilytica]|uniref:Uncharacterized protein n=1 Tax=Iodidimonas gelatinilytica TaxID=1236966 RepID=A0A5A7MV32_9PROT|nr:hypothetical protein [Iodidimonas gelatinilytica]GEQ98908.1 hypothetical protein JCM17844_25450 [Iodidimonas gelatinilytica]
MSTISPQTALVYIMVLVSASDRTMSDSELRRMVQSCGICPLLQTMKKTG